MRRPADPCYWSAIPAFTPDLDALPGVIHAPRTDAIYNCHAYLTKVPIAAIGPFIETFTRPGEVVADMFAGSGMTGLAAVMAGRVAQLSDISVLGQHIGLGYLAEVDADELRTAGGACVRTARAAISDFYATRRIEDGAEVEIVRTIWSFAYACPACTTPFVYFEHLDAEGRAPAKCPSCGATLTSRRMLNRVDQVPVRVVVVGVDGKQVEQPVQSCDLERIARAAVDARLPCVPSRVIARDREMFARSGLARAGIRETRQFFAPRNAIALLELWNAIGALTRDELAAKLRFAFTACLARASRRYQWGPARPLNAQNQTYYVAPVHFEWNVFDLFTRKVEAVRRADALLHRPGPRSSQTALARVDYRLASADALDHLADASVDYVFCDPPFGSNIFYSDMNLFHEAWLGRTTDDGREAVMHTSGVRKHGAADRYEGLLQGAFAEAFRVLRPGRWMSVVFGNSSGGVWTLLQDALRRAGFSPPIHVAILDKGQRSVKGLASGTERVVTVDLVLTVRKSLSRRGQRSGGARRDADLQPLLEAAVERLARGRARNPSYLYAAVLREAIDRGLALDRLHYGKLLAWLRDRGHSLDPRTGRLNRAVTARSLSLRR